MGAQLRVYRRRIRSVQSTKKITRAMELIAASRIIKAQQRVTASQPFTDELVRVLEAAASNTTVDHPLTTRREDSRRAALVVVTSDRGLAGAYSTNAIKRGEALARQLREEGREVVPYLVGRKAISFYRFRGREIAGEWSGFSESPSYADAQAIARRLLEDFLREDDQRVDEIHVVYTRFVSMVTQESRARQIVPIEVVNDSGVDDEGGLAPQAEPSRGEARASTDPLYEFEPSPDVVLDTLLPSYIENLIYQTLLQSTASEHAARRRAMKSATDNAEELIKSLSRAANAARQAEITQEISEIVGGANALADATAGSE